MIIAVFKRQIPVIIQIIVKNIPGQMIGINPALGADDTPRNIIEWRVNTAPDPRQARLIGSIAIGGPLKRDIHTGPLFKTQKPTIGGNMKLTHAAREILIAREQGQRLRSGPRVCRMTRDIPGKRGCDESFSLIGHPVVGQHPARAGVVGCRISDRTKSLPGV